MSEHTEKALAWMREVVQQAFVEAQAGDTTLLNKLGFYPSLQYYINNVHGRAEHIEAQWRHWYPQHIREVVGLYENYLRQVEAEAQATRLASLEEKLATLAEQIRTLTEAQQSKKRGRPRKAEVDENGAEEGPQEDTAEQGQEEPEASADQAEGEDEEN